MQRHGHDQDCLVCAIISHGNKNGNIATMDDDIYIETFCQYLSVKKCSVLRGKPKIILRHVSLVVECPQRSYKQFISNIDRKNYFFILKYFSIHDGLKKNKNKEKLLQNDV